MDMAGGALGLLVTCVDGRPIKVEGNPDHPSSLGAANAFAQAAILELYDPDRSKVIIEKTPQGEEVRSWGEFAEFARGHFGKLRKNGGEGLRVLSGDSSSLTRWLMWGDLAQRFPEAKLHVYEPTDLRSAAREMFSGPHWQFHPGLARVIVCLDADIFGSHPAAVRHAREFAEGRKGGTGEMSRLYVAEAAYSLTGAAADHRLALPRKDIAALARAVHHEVRGLASGKPYRATENRFVRAVAKDLFARRGESILVAGPGQPAAVYDLVFETNRFLGVYDAFPLAGEPGSDIPSHADDITALAADLSSGEVQTLLIVGGNPAYDSPVDLGFSDAISRATTSIHVGPYRDETSRLCTWHVPQAHFLEAWGDSVFLGPMAKAPTLPHNR